MTDPTWAGRAARTPDAEPEPQRATWVPTAALVGALAMVGAGGYVLGTAGGGEAELVLPPTTTATTITLETSTTFPSTTTTEPDPIEAAEPTMIETTSTTETAPSTTAVAGGSDSDSATDGTGEPAETDQTTQTPQVVVDDGETRGAVLRDGVLYLGGAVPSREVADQIIERAAAVVGADRVVDEYVIDPDAVLAPGAPLYVDDVVLFAYGERAYDPQFEPLLDLGLKLLLQNPSVTVTIVTHTDASGPASYNHRLSYQRGESVAQYWVDRGVPVDQIRIDARGEHEPRADNHTPEGAQLNRRAEFYIEGLLG